MRFSIVALAALLATACAAPQTQSPPKAEHHGAGSRASRSQDAAAEVMKMEYDMPDPLHYSYALKTSNGIDLAEQAALDSPAGKVQGAYSFVADDGQTYKVEYTADEQGFHPTGAHLPVAPEGPAIPAAILRSLEWIAAHPDAEARRWDEN